MKEKIRIGAISRKHWCRRILSTITVITSAAVIITGAIIPCAAEAAEASTIIEEWGSVKAPPPPEIKPVTVDAKSTALLIMDVQNDSCSTKRRPRCVASLPKIAALLAAARSKGATVIYSLTSKGTEADIRKEISSIAGEPFVKSNADKFYATDLEKILKDKGIKTVIMTGTAAHGAVLHTAASAAPRGFKVIVPVDTMSAEDAYAEQYTAWHLVNSPATRSQTTLTQSDLVKF